MSHFSVLVIADDPEAALQPFHEFECTGTVDQYIVDIDETDEKRKEFETGTRSMVKMPDGSLVPSYDDRWYRKPTAEELAGNRFADRIREIPAKYEQLEVKFASVGDWAEYVGAKVVHPGEDIDLNDEHKFGYVQVDEAGQIVKAIRRTNPNRKWDWWQEGGRWSNKLLRKDGTRCDSALAGEIDWDGMVAAKAEDAAKTYDAVLTVLAGRPVITWAQAYARVKAGELTIDAARELYNGQQVVKELIAAKAIDDWHGSETLSKVMASERADYTRRESETNASTWALLHNGVWSERGDMGWFGMSDATDESTAKATADFWQIVRALPPEQLVTVVDCHI